MRCTCTCTVNREITLKFRIASEGSKDANLSSSPAGRPCTDQ